MICHRRVLACTLVAMVLLGPVPSALAQAPAPTAVEVMPPERPADKSDIYDIGATVATVARAPFNAALCGLGAVTGTVLFVLTFGSAYRATARVLEEGCAQRWIIRGDDLRPRGGPGVLPDRSSEMYHRR